MKSFRCLRIFRAGFMVILAVLPVANVSAQGDVEPEMDWKTLASITTDGRKVPQKIKPWIGKRVKVGGFIIANEMNMGSLTEFILSAVGQGCVHVPPPPPNYMIHVMLPAGKAVDYFPGPVLVHGKLDLAKDSSYIYEMTAEFMEVYPPRH